MKSFLDKITERITNKRKIEALTLSNDKLSAEVWALRSYTRQTHEEIGRLREVMEVELSTPRLRY